MSNDRPDMPTFSVPPVDQRRLEPAAFVTGVDTWIFDLDDTLYPRSSGLHERMVERVVRLIQDLTGTDAKSAAKLHARYYSDYGTSMVGLMRHHGVSPDKYIEFVHKIDISSISRSHELNELLSRLPGKLIVFTNGSKNHANRILSHLGIQDAFDEVFGVEASDFIGKPDARAYDAMISSCDVDPSRAIMFDDRQVNLEVPRALGMRTVLVSENGITEEDGSHATTNSVLEFLRSVHATLKS